LSDPFFLSNQQILTPSPPEPQPIVGMDHGQTMTITLSVTVPSFVTIIVFLVAFVIRRRQVARRDIERVEVLPGNVMLLGNISQRVQDVTEENSLLSPMTERRVLRSSTRNLTTDTML
jgi:hypothetical protein